ncbi:MAG: hypothetical protein C0476_06085 [Sphingomonas sp.]|nr:hypothetical protein [Sphingomonas sp.]
MNKVYQALIVAAALGVAGPGLAAYSEFNGSAEIARGDYAAAEKVIVKQRKMFANDADLIVNLAMVYRKTNRADEARALYQRLLKLPSEELEMAGRLTTSHRVAREALAKMDMLAAR